MNEKKVNNKLRYTGSREQMKAVSAYLRKMGGIKKQRTQFSLIKGSIPPEGLKPKRSVAVDLALKVLFDYRSLGGSYSMRDARNFFTALPRQEQEECLLQAIDSFHTKNRTGFADLDQWSGYTGYEYSQPPQGYIEIEFASQLTSSLDLILNLSKEFPTLSFHYDCSNEKIDRMWNIEGGEIVREFEFLFDE